MDTYRAFQNTGVNIAHRLMKMNGWNVYGYTPDRSDWMTDYYAPAYWNGIAEKNGYVFVYNCDRASEGYTREEYETVTINDNKAKIEKLRQMTQARGASAAEEETAKRKIERLLADAKETKERTKKTVVVEVAHMANPPRMKWHIEKDGVVLDKGTGMTKFANVWDINNPDTVKRWQKFNTLTREDWIADHILKSNRYNDTYDERRRSAEYFYGEEAKQAKLLEEFNEFINRIDTVCGGLVGGGGYEYKKVVVTEYKKENKAVLIDDGEIAEGNYFTVTNGNFNHGVRKGDVFKFTTLYYDKDGNVVGFIAKRLDGKLRKVLEGKANLANQWGCTTPRFMDKFKTWLEKDLIHFCKIEEVATPYQVEKLVKVPKGAAAEEAKPKSKYAVEKTVHTKTGADIWVVKLTERVDMDGFKAERAHMKEFGGYYSKFVHGFVFDHDPTEEIK